MLYKHDKWIQMVYVGKGIEYIRWAVGTEHK